MKAKSKTNKKGPLLTRTVLRVGSRLQLTDELIGRIIGVSDATVCRMRHGHFVLTEKPLELAVLLIRLFDSLERMVDGNEQSARSWLRSHNTVLNGVPIEKIRTISGLAETISYLETRLARV
jgi:Protein of unknown function (DUF2384)